MQLLLRGRSAYRQAEDEFFSALPACRNRRRRYRWEKRLAETLSVCFEAVDASYFQVQKRSTLR
jgi:hypothetical protein